MKQNRLSLVSIFTMMGVFACSSAFAMSAGPLPPEKTQGQITYITGGVGSDEAAAVKQAESKYPLSLEFVQHAKPRDEFLANVDVTIRDQAGKTALKTTSDGPFLLAKMPNGKYTVTAEEEGKTITRHFTVAANKPQHLVLAW